MGKYFNDIYGQKNATAILSAQLNSGNLSHGYVFLGKEGTGKNYLAFEFARHILALGLPKQARSDFSQNDLFNHPDFIFVDGIEGIKIEAIREVIERINLSPNLSRYKVLMLSHAENIGIEAANALLKTLEEPPSDSIIILTTISEKSLPETIISRVQKIKLNTVGRKDIAKILTKEYSDDELAKVLGYAEGSIGEAKRMLSDPEYAKQKVSYFESVEELLGPKKVVEKFAIIDRYEKQKDLKKLFDIFASSVIEKLSRAQKGDQVGLSLEVMHGVARKTLKIYADLDYNVNLRLAFESLILEYLAND